MYQANILIADDNPDIVAFLAAALEQDGHTVIRAASGAEALTQFLEHKPDLAILDITMGRPDGIEVSRSIRAKSTIPIIILTGKDSNLDEVMSLSSGADDFVVKPATAQVISLRVSGLLRRSMNQAQLAPRRLICAGLILDLDSHDLIVNNADVPLTRTEFKFLELLMGKPNRVFTRDEVYDAIEGSSEFSSSKLLDTHASRIRMKIRAAGGGASIAVVRGVGYKILNTSPS